MAAITPACSFPNRWCESLRCLSTAFAAQQLSGLAHKTGLHAGKMPVNERGDDGRRRRDVSRSLPSSLIPSGDIGATIDETCVDHYAYETIQPPYRRNIQEQSHLICQDFCSFRNSLTSEKDQHRFRNFTSLDLAFATVVNILNPRARPGYSPNLILRSMHERRTCMKRSVVPTLSKSAGTTQICYFISLCFPRIV